MLYCSNYTCQAPNSESNKFCQNCRTPLIRRYLLALSPRLEGLAVGETLSDRYLYKGDRVFLDTKPGLFPDSPLELTHELSAYLRLSPYQLHVPQLYGSAWVGVHSATPSEIVLLEHIPVTERAIAATSASPPSKFAAGPSSGNLQVQLLPALTSSWAKATGLRQLYWLWQLAQLWQPFAVEHVASSLLNPALMRVEGPIVRLLELAFDDEHNPPTLVHLGQLWREWGVNTRPECSKFLAALCDAMIRGQIQSIETVLDHLDQALKHLEQSQSLQVHLVSVTDQGPSRQRNEDACYPPSGTHKAHHVSAERSPAQEDTFLIVCDGIGGHQGGDVASHMAIETVKQRLEQLPVQGLASGQLHYELETSVCVANDAISQNNDAQQRRERERMGTTLVMGLMLRSELYVTHVGDSRAYWITRWGCHQITQDDDIASREVRLGYNTYRNALQHPSAGSLVQALGMGSSTLLHPTVQKFWIDEDSIFLFCSDGLSDNDRIEAFWETVLLPVLEKKANLTDAAQQLVAIANTHNGYDNVTVGLIHYQVKQHQPIALSSDLGYQVAPSHPGSPPVATTPGAPPARRDTTKILAGSRPKAPAGGPSPESTDGLPETTQLIQPAEPRPHRVGPLLAAIALLLGLGATFTYMLFPSVGARVNQLLGLSSTPPEPSDLPSPVPSPSLEPAPASVTVGSFVQVSRSTSNAPPGTGSPSVQPLVLFPSPGGSSFPASPNNAPSPSVGTPSGESTPVPSAVPPAMNIQQSGLIPAGSVLQVLSKQEDQNQERWVRLKVCSIPGSASAAGGEIRPGEPASNPLPNPASSTPDGSPSPSPSAPLAVPPSGTTPAAPPSASSGAALPLLEIGEVGWIREIQVAPLVLPSSDLETLPRGVCS